MIRNLGSHGSTEFLRWILTGRTLGETLSHEAKLFCVRWAAEFRAARHRAGSVYFAPIVPAEKSNKPIRHNTKEVHDCLTTIIH